MFPVDSASAGGLYWSRHSDDAIVHLPYILVLRCPLATTPDPLRKREDLLHFLLALLQFPSHIAPLLFRALHVSALFKIAGAASLFVLFFTQCMIMYCIYALTHNVLLWTILNAGRTTPAHVRFLQYKLGWKPGQSYRLFLSCGNCRRDQNPLPKPSSSKD